MVGRSLPTITPPGYVVAEIICDIRMAAMKRLQIRTVANAAEHFLARLLL